MAKRDVLAFLAGMGTGYISTAAKRKETEKEDEVKNILKEAYGDQYPAVESGIVAPQPPQKIPPGAIDESGATRSGSDAVIQGLGGAKPTGQVMNMNAQPGLVNQAMPVPQTNMQPGTSLPSNVVQMPQKTNSPYSGFTEKTNKAIRLLIQKGHIDAATKLLETNKAVQEYTYQDALRVAQPYVQQWYFGKNPEAASQAMTQAYADGSDYRVEQAGDDQYTIHRDGEVFADSLTHDQITQMMSTGLGSKGDYIKSITEDLKAKQARSEKLEDRGYTEKKELETEWRGHGTKLAEEQRTEARDIRKESRGLINERAKRNTLRPITEAERKLYPNIPEGATVQVDADGKIVPVNFTGVDDGKPTANGKDVKAMVKAGVFATEKEAWAALKNTSKTADVVRITTMLVKEQAERISTNDPAWKTPQQLFEEAKRIAGDTGNTGGQPQIQEGATATNPQTGQKVIFQNGQWVPAQ